ncbi:DUF2628 domain-containing protein [Diaphorobacter caeni]|uniref:DUF2628 domain-containing protein n=1 Tax=Diaphorobacter caeni TaxID=2784387 RepID=UPI00188F6B54|nr:DUF2628 domain-containing protein [Diaphorobacter caeni]MBF5004757.1 DUF2628 domain-containing protein [Diaphorobacter caeni]
MTTSQVTPSSAPTSTSADPLREQKIQRALLRAYVDKNYEKYQRMWDKAETKKSRQSWNWAAFFLSFSWFAYRKMYVPAAIWIALIVGETIASMVFGYAERYSSVFSLGLAFGAGQVGNTVYALHSNKQVDQVKAALPSSHWVSNLRSKGGVSWLAGIGAFVILIVLLITVMALGGKL